MRKTEPSYFEKRFKKEALKNGYTSQGIDRHLANRRRMIEELIERDTWMMKKKKT